jgi:hypothetical protein
MATFFTSSEVKTITNGGSTPALGNPTLTLTIPNQRRRLKSITLQANVTATKGTGALTHDSNYTETIQRLFKGIRVRVSDIAGNNRLLVDTNSSALLYKTNFDDQHMDRYTARAISVCHLISATQSGMDVFYRIPIKHQLLGGLVGYRTALPLSGKYLGGPVTVELDLADNAAAIGLTVNDGSFTINWLRANIEYLEIDDELLDARNATVGYIPQEVKTTRPTINSNMIEFERKGWLASFILEAFTNSNYIQRNALLASAGSDLMSLYYGRQEKMQWTEAYAVARSDWWADFMGLFDTSLTAISPLGSGSVYCVDLLHSETQDNAVTPDSMLNLYTDNVGESAYLKASAITAGRVVQLTTHKFLVPDLGILVGG